jgi:hypothetical protein
MKMGIYQEKMISATDAHRHFSLLLKSFTAETQKTRSSFLFRIFLLEGGKQEW